METKYAFTFAGINMVRKQRTVEMPHRIIGGKKYWILDSAPTKDLARQKAQILAGRFEDIVIKQFTYKRIKKWGVMAR